jgi:hypothetical protein
MDDNTRILLLLRQIVHYNAIIACTVQPDGASFSVRHMGCAICEDQIRCVVWCGGEDMRTAVVAMVAIHVVRCF